MEITNTAINRVVSHQWANLPQQSWTGNYNGLSYSITLNEPTIVLEPNKIVTQLSLTISSSANGQTVYNGTLAVSPELVIPANTIDLGNIVTQYVNLRQSIDQLAVLVGVNDSRLNQVIENVLSPIDWIMYAGNAIEQSQVRWSDEADIRWSELPDITYQIFDGKIFINVNPIITSAKPLYLFGIEKSGSNYRIKIRSNNHVEILNVRLVWILGNNEYTATYNSGQVSRVFDNVNQLFEHTTPWIGTSYGSNGSWVVKVRMKRANFETTYEYPISIYSNGTYWTGSTSAGTQWKKDD